MTPHEMPAVLEYLQASFARRLGDAEVGVWAEHAERLDRLDRQLARVERQLAWSNRPAPL